MDDMEAGTAGEALRGGTDDLNTGASGAGAAPPPDAGQTVDTDFLKRRAPVKKRRRRRLPPWFFPALAAAGLAAAGLTFYLRAPALVVSDDAFRLIYGAARERRTRILGSLRAFRRIKIINLATGADPDAATYAVDAASRGALCVIFPYRYQAIARQYAALEPEGGRKRAPAFVLTERNTPPAEDETAVHYISCDLERDFYRAGEAAAFFALEQASEAGEAASKKEKPEAENAAASPGGIAVFEDSTIPRSARTAFEDGLAQGGYEQKPEYRSLDSDAVFSREMGCVVVTGAAQAFLTSKSQAPLILFSWFDPAYMPPLTKLVFDDSPLGLTPQIARLCAHLKDEPPAPLHAQVWVSERIPLKQRWQLWRTVQR